MPHQTSQLRAPHELLYSHVRTWNYCDVLIDRMAGFPFQKEIEALGDPLVHRCILTDRIFSASQEQAPLLVRLPGTQVELLEKFLSHALQEAADPEAQTRTVCAFLFSPLAQPSLGKLLSKRLDVPVHSVGNIYFRYFDPRVTHHLPRILNKNQLSELFHGVQTWLYVGWDVQLNAITTRQQENVSQFPLTVTQWRQMQEIEIFNLAVRRLRQEGYINGKSAAEIEMRLLAAVRSAETSGLIVPEDQAVFAAYALKFDNAFTQHVGLANAISTAVEHSVPFADTVVHCASIMSDATSLLPILE